MTLANKMLLKTTAVMLSLVLLAMVAAWGIRGLTHDMNQALDGLTDQSTDLTATLVHYEKLSEVYAVERSATYARRLIDTKGPLDPDTLRIAHRVLERLEKISTSTDSENLLRQQHTVALRAAIAATEAPPTPATTQPASGPASGGASGGADQPLDDALNALTGFLDNLAHSVEKNIADIAHRSSIRQEDSKRLRAAAFARYRDSMILLTVISAAIIVGAALLGWSQYRDVTKPLARLRAGVRSITKGRFEQRLSTSEDQEFAELARDFNQMTQELQALYHELEDKVAAKSKELVRSERLASVGFLAAGVAHEINNPLGIITGYAELAIRALKRLPDSGQNAETLKSLQTICDEAFRCKEITQKLLALSRGGVAGGEARQVISLARIASEVTESLTGLRPKDGRQVALRFPTGEPLDVLANPTEMKQVLLNLTVNALDALAGPDGHVEITGRRDADWIELSVTDTGKGMTRQTLDRVFEPFYTEKRGTETAAAGTGLGLSIAHAIVESHAGQISAHSAGPGTGSRFVVRLPAAKR